MKCEELIPFVEQRIGGKLTYFLACTATPNVLPATGDVEPHIHTVTHPATGETHYFPKTPRQEPQKDWS